MNPNDGEGLDTWEARRQGMLAKGYNGNGCGTPLAIAVQQWPTPQTTDMDSAARHTTDGAMHAGTSLTDAIRKDWPSPIAEDAESRTSNGTLLDSVRGNNWQTPQTSDANGPREADGKRGLGLNTQAVEDWSTPTCRDRETLAKVTRGQGATPGGTPLLVQVQQWPTPQAHDATGGRGKNNLFADSHYKPHDLTDAIQPDWLTPQSRDHKGISQKPATGEFTGSICDQLLEMQGSGPPGPASSSTTGSRPVVLNPRWVAALMGFPVDWLDGVAPPSRPSGTRSSRKSPKSSPEKSEPSSKGSE